MTEFKLDGFDHVAIGARDVAAAVAWYREILGLEQRFEEEWGNHPAIVCVGDACVAIFPADGEPAGGDTIQHIAFRVDRANFERAREVFRERGLEKRFADHGLSHSAYISDPDGHTIEITTYEV